jgi:hypothetical protein
LQLCRQLDNFVEGIFQVDDTIAKISKISSVTSQPSASPLRSVQSAALLGARRTPQSASPRVELSDGDGSPGIPKEAERRASMILDNVPADPSTWHRWFAVRPVYVLLEVNLSGVVRRHGAHRHLLSKGREALLNALSAWEGGSGGEIGKTAFARVFSSDVGHFAFRPADLFALPNQSVLARIFLKINWKMNFVIKVFLK